MKQAKKQKWLRSAAKKPGALKAWLLLFAGVLGTILSPFLVTQTANAQAAVLNPYIDQETHDDVVAYAYRNAFGSCLGSGDIVLNGDREENPFPIWQDDPTDPNDKPPETTSILAANVANGQWFAGGKDVTVTPLVTDDGMRDCDTRALINRAVESWWGAPDNNIPAACAMGLIERMEGGDCVTGQGDFNLITDTRRGSVLSVIDEKRFPNGWSWTPARYYVLYSRAMEIGCYATPIIAAEDASADDMARYGTDEYVQMDVVGRDGSVTRDMIYRLGNEKVRSSEINMVVSPNAFDNQNNTCAELAELASQYANDYAQYVKDHPPAEDDPGAGASEGEGGGENATQCDIQGIGWIVCPAMLFIGDVVDGAYGVVAGFLSTSPVSTDTGSPLFQAWSFMRNFANVAFVIVFLVIIYSQITSAGISNYNIKKMLPRLIMAAILVNVSYWVCAIAVDISNILGFSIKDLFDNVSGELFPTTPNLGSEVNQQWSPVILGLIGGAAVGVALYAGLSMLLPLLVGALISIITALIILTLRQALIIILIVISPIAFVAFLLPNTQSLFDRWRKLFFTLLLMFPLVAVIFGGSALAGVVIQQSAGDDNFLQILALGVSVIPLFITVFISKMISMIGGVAGKLIGAVNDPTKGLFDRARRGAEGMRDRQQMRRAKNSLEGGKFLGSDRYKRRAKREVARAGLESEFKRSQSAYVADAAKNDEGFRNRLAGGTRLQGASPEALTRALASAINVQASLEADEVKANHAIIKDANIDNDIGALQDLALGKEITLPNGQKMQAAPGSSLQTAAIQKQFEIGDIGMTDGLVAASGNMGVKQRQTIADGMTKLSSKVKYYGGTGSADVAAGKIKSEADLDKLVADAVAGNKLNSAETLVLSDKDALSRISKVAANRSSVTSDNTLISDEAITNLRNAAVEARADPILGKKAGGNVMQKIQAIEQGRAFK